MAIKRDFYAFPNQFNSILNKFNSIIQKNRYANFLGKIKEKNKNCLKCMKYLRFVKNILIFYENLNKLY